MLPKDQVTPEEMEIHRKRLQLLHQVVQDVTDRGILSEVRTCIHIEFQKEILVSWMSTEFVLCEDCTNNLEKFIQFLSTDSNLNKH